MTEERVLREAYEALVEEGTRLAGGLRDLVQRETVYHYLFEDSGGNHAFPLIAAHGALWAGGYFRLGRGLGSLLAWQRPFSPRWRRDRLRALDLFADAFRDVNRRVCVDTYASYHFTKRFGDRPAAERFVRPALLDALRTLHAARAENRELPDAGKRRVFESHFLDEQAREVGPALDAAVAALDWPLARAIALRPRIRFAYFPPEVAFWFRNFADREERIEKGLRAFDTAATVGWCHVEASLRGYDLLPRAFFAASRAHFGTLRNTALAVPIP
jgi:hypothetical protein